MIEPTGLQLKAVEHLERRIHFGEKTGEVVEDDPITLTNGTVVTPILTNPEQVKLRYRQRGIPFPR